ncbi:hypothetical protein BDZ97DRAFT_1138456 [Flammula alnicola]|nr:hypothetical protein BDZ97DRAFT_1138456 [Flammula alnicola]
MDGAAFMAVPASSFSPMPQPSTNELAEAAVTASPYAQVNGAAQHAEGERRRKEMLDHAISLEKRYSYLLPPDRVRKTQDSFISERNQVDGRDEEESETERISHAGPSKKEIESIKFRIPARSSTSTTPAPSPAAAKLPPTKKGRASAQPRQPLSARSIQSTISLSVPPQDQVPSTASPYIDVEMQTPEPALVTSPPPPSASPLLPTEVPESLYTPLPEIEVTSSRPPTPVRPLNGRTRAQKDVSALPNIVSNGAEIQPSVKVTARQAPRPRGIEVRTQDEGESEKAPSEDGNAQAGEAEGVVAELISKPDEAAEVEAEAKMLGPDEVAPEVREISTRMEQATFAGAPGMGVEGPEVPSERFDHEGRTAEGLSHAVSPGAEESISTRPLKRQRKMSAKARAQSIAQSHARRTPSAPPIPESVSSRLGRKFGPRGQQSQTYLSSTTGEEVRTTSFLMMAAIRSEGAKRSSEKRHLSSFGIVTPAFKENYDFEIPEWLHYPDDEEPAIPIPDDTIAVDQVEPVPEVLAKAVEGEGQTVPEPAEPEEAMDTDTVEPNVEEEMEPTQPEVAETETVEPTESSDAIQVMKQNLPLRNQKSPSS